MNGAESLIRTLLAGRVDTCFTNPGTSEIHIVAALDRIAEMRCVLGLFEGVVTGAADGYARMAEKPACTLLHLGPGLGNGLANLHNASRAQVPIVNLIGQHATYHLALRHTAHLRHRRHRAALFQMVAHLSRFLRNRPRRGRSGRCRAYGAWPDCNADRPRRCRLERGRVRCAASPRHRSLRCRTADDRACSYHATVRLATAILIGGNALYGKGLVAAGRIAAATGAKLLAPYPITRLQRGAGIPRVDRVQYVLEQGIEQFKEFRQLILVGAQAPVAYFAYPGKKVHSPRRSVRSTHWQAPAKIMLARSMPWRQPYRCAETELPTEKAERPPMPSGEITLQGLAAAVGALLPENAIVVDESMTSGRGLMAATKGAPPHDWLGNTGGSIGIALPLAVGAAVACPDRRVLCLTADGSGMYTAQALWTMAREGLNVTTVVFANHDYAVLKREFSYLGVGSPGPRAADMFEIGRPDLDWTLLAKGMGVPGTRVSSLDAFGKALRAGLEGEGPTLIEVPL